MTAIAVPTTPRRIATTVRVHLSNPWALLYMPALITLGVFALNFTVWHIVLFAAGDDPLEPDAFDYNGGGSWVMFYAVVVAVQAMNQTFSFTVGLGSTRRDYYLGTSLIFVMLSVTFGVGLALLAGVERLTDGWGVGGRFFAPSVLQTVPVWELAAIYTLAMMLLMFVGAACGASFVRWAATGLIAFLGSLLVLAVAIVFLIVWGGWWQPIVDFFAARTPWEIALLSLPITIVAGLGGFALLRRATPKG